MHTMTHAEIPAPPARRERILIALLAACSAAVLLLTPAPAAAAEETVRSVDVRIEYSGATPPSVMQDRIRNSVESTGRRALEGKTLEDALALRQSLQDVLRNIFNEVLSGYAVDDMTLTIAPSTILALRLRPDGPVIGGVHVALDLPQSIHPTWNQLFQQSGESIGAELETLFAGVPVRSAAWSQNLLRTMVETLPLIADTYPGFTPEVSVVVGETTDVVLRLRASENPIKIVTSGIRSNTIPSLLLDTLKFKLGSEAELLLGLPVEFARRKEAVLMREITRALEESDQKRRYFLTFQVYLTIGRQTNVLVQAESARYSGFLRGRVSLGKTDRNPDFEGHYGLFVRPGTELFTEVNFFPGPIEMQANLGFGHRFSKDLYIAAGRNFTDGLNRMWVTYIVSPSIQLSWERGVEETKKKLYEGAITYRAHEYFSIELVTDFRTDVWLRFVANL
jgi:hypothetical protein